MLMAAGLGTRLRPFSLQIPKPLTPILGVPCARFAVDALVSAGVRDIVANLHFLPQATREGLVKMEPETGATFLFSDEVNGLLGSAGGIRRALPLLAPSSGTGPFFVLNADTLCSLDLQALAETHLRLRRERGVTMTLALLKRRGRAEESYRELVLDESGDLISGIGEKTEHGLMYVGCGVFERAALAQVPEGGAADFLETILRPQVAAAQVGAHVFEGSWMDVGSPRLWWQAHLELIEGLESRTLPEAWSQLLRSHCRRLAPRVWVSNQAPSDLNASEWVGPCFWDGHGKAPRKLGPGTVLYGEPTAEADPSRPGIGCSGYWTELAILSPQD